MDDKYRDDEFEALKYQLVRDHNGNAVPIDLIRHNGKLEARIPPELTEPYLLPADRQTPDYAELVEEICQNLTAVERRRWMMAAEDNLSMTAIGEIEGVQRPAVTGMFARMAKRNPYVALWRKHKKNVNQHE